MSPSTKQTGAVLLAPSPANVTYDAMYYLKGAAAGGICCSITHGALCPVDVVKTRVQLDSAKVCLCICVCPPLAMALAGIMMPFQNFSWFI